jgi:hypothetical protein
MALIFLTTASVSPWTPPGDWPGFADRVELIGAGGNGFGRIAATRGGSGGGGGAYVALAGPYTVGAGATFVVAAGGSAANTTFNSSAFVATPGANATLALGGSGGAAAGCTVPAGGVTSSGGNGFSTPTGSNPGGSGGGGAAGINGAGVAATSTIGGNGDNGTTVAPGAGTAGTAGTEMDATHGSGSGGSGFASGTNNGTAGGSYGGGGSGASSGSAASTGGVGGDGLIAITYTPAGAPPPAILWPMVLPDLPAFRRYQALPESTVRLDPQPTAPPPAILWPMALPDLPARRARRRPAAMVATGGNLAPGPIAAAAGPSLTAVLRSVNLRYAQARFRPAAMVATGSNGPEQWPLIAAVAISTGFDFVTQISLPPARINRAGAAEPASPELTTGPQPIVQAFAYGWSIVLPDIRRLGVTARAALADGLTLPLGGQTAPPGWTVTLADLRQVKPRIGFTDASISPEAWAPLVTTAPSPWGWSLPPPAPTQARLSPAAMAATGGILPPEQIPQTAPWGWSICLPDLPAFRRYQALPESTVRLDPQPAAAPPAILWPMVLPDLPARPNRLSFLVDQAALYSPPAPPAALPTGWSIVLPDLPAFRRKQALPESAGRLDQPQQALPTGWTVTLPDLPARKIRASIPDVDQAALYNPPAAPAALPTGWSIVQPDLPAFRRFQAFPELSGRIDQPPPPPAPFPVGWSIVLPDLPARQAKASVPDVDQSALYQLPAPVTAPTGWSIVQPDLPAFRRFLQPARISIQSPAPPAPLPPLGWSIVQPDLPAFRRKQALPAIAGRADPPLRELATGWSVVLPDLPAFRRKQALPELTRRLDLVPSAIAPPQTAILRANYLRYVPARTAPAAMAATGIGGWLAPAPAPTPPTAVGWSVTLPLLPAFRRRHALPEFTARLDPLPPFAPVAVVSGWDPGPPHLPAFRRFLQPTRISIQTPVPLAAVPPIGWSVEQPLLRKRRVSEVGAVLVGAPTPTPLVVPLQPAPVLRSVNLRYPQAQFRPAGMIATGANLISPPTPVPPPSGWTIALPDLRAVRRYQALPEIVRRVESPALIVAPAFPYGWSIVLPLLRQHPLPLSAIVAGPVLPLLPVTPALPAGWTITLPDSLITGRRALDTLIRIDQPVPVSVVPPVLAGWNITLPDLRVLRAVRRNDLWWQEDAAACLPLPLPPPPPVLPTLVPAGITAFARGSMGNRFSGDLAIAEGVGPFVGLIQRLQTVWQPPGRALAVPADIILPYDLIVICHSVIFDLSVAFRSSPIVAASVLAPPGSIDTVQSQIIASPLTGEPATAVKVIISGSGDGSFSVVAIDANGRVVRRRAKVSAMLTDPVGSSVVTPDNSQVLLIVGRF